MPPYLHFKLNHIFGDKKPQSPCCVWLIAPIAHHSVTGILLLEEADLLTCNSFYNVMVRTRGSLSFLIQGDWAG